jgi:CRISPR-associated protein Csb1
MEPVFKSSKKERENWLVPQIQIALGKDAGDIKAPRLSLLDLAHRGADAVVQSSGELAKQIKRAFSILRQNGDASELCAIAPTSLVFGVWDSRGGSSEKRPRLVRSVIRAWDVEVLHAAAQFNSVWKELDETQQKALQDEAKKQKKKLSVKGFADAPAIFRDTKSSQYFQGSPNPEARVLGGVLVNGSIQRDVTINLVALRGLQADTPEESKALRSYLLALALTAATAEIDLFLREGCHLRFENEDKWHLVNRRGKPAEITLDAGVISTAAETGAKHFRSKWPKEMEYTFDVAEAKKLLAAKEEEEQSPE